MRALRALAAIPIISACAESPDSIEPLDTANSFSSNIDCNKLEEALSSNYVELVAASQHQDYTHDEDVGRLAACIPLSVLLTIISGMAYQGIAIAPICGEVGSGDMSEPIAQIMGERNQLMRIAAESRCEFEALTTVEVVDEAMDTNAHTAQQWAPEDVRRRREEASISAQIEQRDTSLRILEFEDNLRKAECGDVEAQHRVGEEYELGEIVTANYTRAYLFYALAERGGYSGPESEQSFVQRMHADQIAQAERLVAAWQPESSQCEDLETAVPDTFGARG